jgi:hypothetical protein
MAIPNYKRFQKLTALKMEKLANLEKSTPPPVQLYFSSFLIFTPSPLYNIHILGVRPDWDI